MPATQILILGPPGSGKSTGWEKMNPPTTCIVTPNAKPLPWENSTKQYIVGKNRIQTNLLTELPLVLRTINEKKPEVNAILNEDFTHFMNARTLDSAFIAKKAGGEAFSKWGEFAVDVFRCIDGAEKFRDDLTIVYHGHTETNEDGKIGMLTSGKLLEREIKLSSYFTYVLQSVVKLVDGKPQYYYQTNDDGVREAKTPKGCFKELFIPNDISMVIKRIREYQGS